MRSFVRKQTHSRFWRSRQIFRYSNGDGPGQSLLRRCHGEEEMVDAVVRFASSRPAKHIGGEIVNRVIAEYGGTHTTIKNNNMNVLCYQSGSEE